MLKKNLTTYFTIAEKIRRPFYPRVRTVDKDRELRVDHRHPLVNRAIHAINEAGLRANGWGAPYVKAGSPKYLRAAATKAIRLFPPRDGLRTLSRVVYGEGKMADLSDIINGKAVRSLEKAVLLAQALHREGVKSAVYSGRVKVDQKLRDAVFVRVGDHFVDMVNANVINESDLRPVVQGLAPEYVPSSYSLRFLRQRSQPPQ